MGFCALPAGGSTSPVAPALDEPTPLGGPPPPPPPPSPPAPFFTTANVYNDPIAAEMLNHRRNIVVGVHGFTSNPTIWWRDGTDSWNNPNGTPANPGLRTTLLNALGPSASQWDAWGLDWREGAAGGILDAFPATANEVNAQMQGQFIAKKIIEAGSYDTIHLLGHSLGGRVVETASNILRQALPNARIHVTFLDAYTPYAWDRVYGSSATYAEHYYTSADTWARFTDELFPSAVNVDVGSQNMPRPDDWIPYNDMDTNPPHFLDNQSWLHNSPHFWYKKTARDPNNAVFGGFGYALSTESGRNPWPPANAPYHRGISATLAANGDVVAIDVPSVGEQPANAITRPVAAAAVTGSARATLDEPNNRFTLDSGSGASTPAYLNLSITTTQPVNFFEFDYEWLQECNTCGGIGRLTFYLQKAGTIFPPSLGFETLLWATESTTDIGRKLSTGKVIWTDSTAGVPTEAPLAAGSYEMRFRLDNLGTFGVPIRIGNIHGGLFAVPAPGGAMLVLATMVLIARRRR